MLDSITVAGEITSDKVTSDKVTSD